MMVLSEREHDVNECPDSIRKTLTADDLAGIAGPLPEGVDILEEIRQASHDGTDRRFLRWQVQYWQEEQETAGLDATIRDPDNPKHVLGETNLRSLVQKLKEWYTEDELMRLLPQVLARFEE
ncbi:MAG: hypothetical protein M9909_08975 [Thermomicrobiales bacterium]|nr:hypothetical protein [Thermomicrobiales bacterium]